MNITADNDRELTVTPDTLSDAIFATMNSLDGFAPLRRSFESRDYDLRDFVASVTRNVLTQLRVRYRVDHHGSSGTWRESAHHETLSAAMDEARRIKADGYGARVVDELKSVVVCNAEWQDDVIQCDPQPIREYASNSRAELCGWRYPN